jgi:hypothetical protein
MRIFYLGHFDSYVGFGRAARDYVLLLEKMGHQVNCCSIDGLQNIAKFGEQWVKRCLPVKTIDYDIAIIHKSPWNQNGVKEFANWEQIPQLALAKQKVYITIFETDLWPAPWKKCFEGFDKIFTASNWQAIAARKMLGENWKNKVFFVPHVVESPSCAPRRRADGRYCFYAEFSHLLHRKGLDILLKGYFSAFSKNDNVVLVVKISDSQADFNFFYNEYDEACQCFNYKQLPLIEICTAMITDDQLDELMSECDTYVCSARGEGFSIPLARAAVMGKRCIYPLNLSGIGWASDYIDIHIDDDRKEILCQETSVITNTFENVKMKIDTSQMKWFEISIPQLEMAMKNCLTMKWANKINSHQYLSSENVGNMLNGALNA